MRVTFVGEIRDAGIKFALEQVDQRLKTDWRFADANLGSTQEDPAALACPFDSDCLVVVVNHRGELDQPSLQSFVENNPLIPVLFLLSSHCEGLDHNRKQWPGVLQIYWHKFAFCYSMVARQWARQGSSDWHLPLTTSFADRRLQQATPDLDLRNCRVGITSLDQTELAALGDELAADSAEVITWGIQQARMASQVGDDLDALVISGELTDPEVVDLLLEVPKLHSPPSVIVLQNFPRPETVAKLIKNGATHVMSKPLERFELSWAVSRFRKFDRLVSELS